MKILLVSESYPPVMSGVSTVVASYAQMVRALHHSVSVITANNCFASSVTTTQGIRTYRIKAVKNYIRPGSSIPIPDYKEIKTIIEKVRPDIIHVHMIASLAIVIQQIAKRMHIPIVATVHAIPKWILTYIPLPPLLFTLCEYILWKYLQRFLNATQHVIAPSEFVKKELIQHGIKTPCSIIPMWITKSKAMSLTDFHCDRKTTYYCFIGRLDVDKNVAFLIRSWILFQNKQPQNVQRKLLIIGSGTQEVYLKRLAEHDPTHSIFFLGTYKENELSYFYQHCHFFCMPALYETQSIVTLQAIAHGKTAILARSGALTEIKRRYPKQVLLYNPTNQHDLVRCFKTQFTKLPKPNMEFYSKQRILRQVCLLYTSVINASS